jgi:hypothetical protein
LRIAVAALAGIVASCVALGTTAAAGDASAFKILKLEGHKLRWQAPEGRTRVVTYAVAAEPTHFPSARNCSRLAPLDRLTEDSKLSGSAVRHELAAAFAMWEAVADIRFIEAANDHEADIVVGAQIDPVGWAFADVFYDVASPEAVKPITRALVCLNPLRRWKIGFDGDLKVYDLRYTLAHEIGHAIGLDHPNGPGQIMGYRYEEDFRSLQSGDIAGAVQLYGPPRPDTEVATTTRSQGTASHQAAARSFGKRLGPTRDQTDTAP